MATTKAITGNVQKNNGGTVLGAGNVDTATNPVTKVVTVRSNAMYDGYGSVVVKATSPAQSGYVGGILAVAGGNFAYQMTAGEYLMRGYSTKINGSTHNALKFPASDKGIRRPIHYNLKTRRLHETAWDYVTGDVTKGGSAGALVTYDADHAATPTMAVPGEFTYKQGKLTPVNDDYKARTAP